MGDNGRVPPLSQRAPGGSGGPRPAAGYTRPVLPESVVQRVRAALEASREREQAGGQEPAESPQPAVLPERAGFAGPKVLPERAGFAEPKVLPEPAVLPKPAALADSPAAPGPAAVQATSTSSARPGPLAGRKAPRPPARARSAAHQRGSTPPARVTKQAVPAAPPLPAEPDDETQPFPAITALTGSNAENPAREVAGAPPEPAPRPRAAATAASPEPPGAARAPEAAARGSAPAPLAPGAAPRPLAPVAVPHPRTPAATSSMHAAAAGSSRPAAGQVPAARRYRTAGILAAVLVLLAIGSVAFALSRHSAGPGPQAQPPTAAGPAIRDRAADWVAAQVSRHVVVSCDPVMCLALRDRGVPAAGLLALGPGRIDPLRSAIIVATEAVRRQLGRRLDSVYAPVVIASFGSGSQRIDVRVIAPHGAAAYLHEMRADVQPRKLLGADLLESPLITASAAARTRLAAGRVDWRLLVAIANLASAHPLSILAFGDSGPAASPDVPLRSADVITNSAYVRSMVSYLNSQSRSNIPAHIHTVRRADGRTDVRIEFAAPSPMGLGLQAPS